MNYLFCLSIDSLYNYNIDFFMKNIYGTRIDARNNNSYFDVVYITAWHYRRDQHTTILYYGHYFPR